MRPYLEKPFTKIGLVEWLKVKALSSSPSTAKQNKKWQMVLPEFKPQDLKKKKKTHTKQLF
jgi:hypothetical protein